MKIFYYFYVNLFRYVKKLHYICNTQQATYTKYTKTMPQINKISDSIFNTLLNKVDYEQIDGSDEIHIWAGHSSYQIDVHLLNDEIIVENFGYKTSSGKWIELEPTKEQLEAFKLKLDAIDEILYQERINEEISISEMLKEQESYLSDPYNFYGVSRTLFI